MTRGRQVSRALGVVLTLSLAGCEDQMGALPVAPPPATPPPAPQPPRPAGEPALVTLMNGGTGVQVRVSDLFMVLADQLDSVRVEVRSENEAVATARLDGTGLMSLVVVEPVAEGDTSVVVTLRTSAGTAMQAIRVTVGPPAAEPPRTVGRVDALTLVVGGKEAELPVGDFFSVDPSQHDEVEVEAFSRDETIATVRAQGTGLMSVVFIRPASAGTVLIEVIVRTSAGSATQLVHVTVVPAPTDPPRAVGEPESFTLVHGGSWQDFYLGSILTTGNRDWDRTAEVEVMPVDETVVAVHIEGRGLDATLFLAPVGPGETVIVVTARNAAGSAIQRIRAVVLPAEPPRLVGRPDPLVLVAGAGGRPWFLDEVFAPPGFLVEAQSLDERVVIPRTAKARGGVYLEPVGPGETFVVVTARNAAGAAEVTGKVTVLEKVRVGLFVRGGSVDGPPIKLEEGVRWNLHIGLVDRDVEGAAAPSAAVKIGIATDAPPDQLRVPESVSNPSIGSVAEPILFTIEALADDVPGEPDATYAISLTGIEGLPPWMELAKEAVRITVVDSPAAACEDLWVNALLDRPSGDERRGNFTIQAPHPDTSVSWAEPYVNRTGSEAIWPTLATHVFPERLPFRELPDGFEQEVRLRWWDGDLRWTIQAPGCEPVELHCDEFTCDVR